MWIHKSRRAVARASRKHRQPSQGSRGGTRVASLALGCAIGLFYQRWEGAHAELRHHFEAFFIRPFVAVRSLIPTRAPPLSPPRDVSPAASWLI